MMLDTSGDSDDATGCSTSALTQDMRDLDLVGTPPGLADPSSWIDLAFAHFIHTEGMRYFPMVSAAGAITTSPAIPRTTAALDKIWTRLGYSPTADDPWRVLGMALLEGPDPEEVVINARLRTALLLCNFVRRAGVDDTTITQLDSLGSKFTRAAADCMAAVPEALRLRKREKVSKLPLHQELGAPAMNDVTTLLPPGVGIRTQWSNLGGGVPELRMI